MGLNIIPQLTRIILQASHAKPERKLQEERATLTAFDNELRDLDHVIKGKKQVVSDFERQLKKLEHDLRTLESEKEGRKQARSSPIWRRGMNGSQRRMREFYFFLER
jgi:predicted  nucleic acid-binding Zn-ribbon protein